MKLVIVTGLSGAGKSVALHSLEDMGAYCIDNLPVSLIPAAAAGTCRADDDHGCVALGVDARGIRDEDLPRLFDTLDSTGVSYQVLFLQASDAVLIKRFSETRRKHPLTSADVPLAEALQRERRLLAPLEERAEISIDTSAMHLHQLRDLVRLRLELTGTPRLSLLFQSFGFKHGIPQDADFIFDVRCLPNPHWEPYLRPRTGQDEAVCRFLESQPKVQQMYDSIRQFMELWVPQFEADGRSYLSVAVGCTGGRHRSVYLSERLCAYFRAQRSNVLLRHRELG